MNKRATISTVLSIAAAAGIAAGAALHNATGPSVAASTSPPATTTATSHTPAPTPTTSTTTPTTTATATTSEPTTPTTSASEPTPVTERNLIGPSDFEAADVSGLRVTDTYKGGPNHDMSICPDVDGPGTLPSGSRAWSRSLFNATTKVSSYQLLVDFASTAAADKHVRWLEDWHADCGTPGPDDPIQDIVVGPIRTESVKGSDTSVWWDTAFVNEGEKRLETVAFTRSGTRVSVVVFAGPTAAIQYADMTTLAGRMAEKMA